MQTLAALLGPAQVIDLKSRTPRATVGELIRALPGPGPALRRQILKAVMEREGTMSTGIGSGIAVPHARLEKISRLYVAVGRSRAGIDFKAPDRRKARLVILIVTPTSQVTAYLQLLASVLWSFSDEAIQERILAAPDAQKALAALASRTRLAV